MQLSHDFIFLAGYVLDLNRGLDPKVCRRGRQPV